MSDWKFKPLCRDDEERGVVLQQKSQKVFWLTERHLNCNSWLVYTNRNVASHWETSTSGYKGERLPQALSPCFAYPHRAGHAGTGWAGNTIRTSLSFLVYFCFWSQKKAGGPEAHENERLADFQKGYPNLFCSKPFNSSFGSNLLTVSLKLSLVLKFFPSYFKMMEHTVELHELP